MSLELNLRVGKTVCEFDFQAGIIGVLEMVFGFVWLELEKTEFGL
jgi:hypothetical protein